MAAKLFKQTSFSVEQSDHEVLGDILRFLNADDLPCPWMHGAHIDAAIYTHKSVNLEPGSFTTSDEMPVVVKVQQEHRSLKTSRAKPQQAINRVAYYLTNHLYPTAQGSLCLSCDEGNCINKGIFGKGHFKSESGHVVAAHYGREDSYVWVTDDNEDYCASCISTDIIPCGVWLPHDI